MSKNWIMLAGLLFLGSVGTSQGHPLDLADIVYVDGQPCNRACQSYLAWSRRRSCPWPSDPSPLKPHPSNPHPLTSHPKSLCFVRRAARPACKSGASRKFEARGAPCCKTGRTIACRKDREAAACRRRRRQFRTGAGQRCGFACRGWRGCHFRSAATAQEQVAATTRPPSKRRPRTRPRRHNRKKIQRRSSSEVPKLPLRAIATEPTVSAATNDTDNRVALLIARPEIASVSDLTGKDIAIEDQQSAPSASISAAIMAAGAAEVRLNEEHMKAIDRLIRGEVPAAVLTLLSPEAAEGFPKSRATGYFAFRSRPIHRRLASSRRHKARAVHR